MRTKFITNVLILLFIAFSFSACSILPKNSNKNTSSKNNANIPTPMLTPAPSKKTTPNQDTFAAIDTKYGQIVFKLYQKEAPNTVANFLKKADSGFYKNLTFHRVEPGFVVQGGDPLGNGTGGGDIKSEINTIAFKKGSLGLARAGNREISNDSQFFICLEDDSCAGLTNDYVNFGEVISGMDFVNSIKIGDKILNITSKTK
jgi:peptidyl-prolyl cis-trans isomerase B (cyclophilin B)